MLFQTDTASAALVLSVSEGHFCPLNCSRWLSPVPEILQVSFVRTSYIENIYLALVLLRCPFLIFVHVPLAFIIHFVILKKKVGNVSISVLSVSYVICCSKDTVHIFFLFFSLIFSKSIEVFLMQSVDFSLKPFMFLASGNSFCVFIF